MEYNNKLHNTTNNNINYLIGNKRLCVSPQHYQINYLRNSATIDLTLSEDEGILNNNGLYEPNNRKIINNFNVNNKKRDYLDLTYKKTNDFDNYRCNVNNISNSNFNDNKIVFNQNIISSSKTINNINLNGTLYENNLTMIKSQKITRTPNQVNLNNINKSAAKKSDCYFDLTNTRINNPININASYNPINLINNSNNYNKNNDVKINLSREITDLSLRNQDTRICDDARNNVIVNFENLTTKSLNKNLEDERIEKLLQSISIEKLKDNTEFYIYVLKCECERYYVGKTLDMRKRLEFHLLRENCKWTKTYKPIKIEKIIISDDCLDEDKWVKKYMIKKGINNVRGGSYCTNNLNKTQIDAIVHEIVHSRGQCFYCLSDSHLVNKCVKRKNREFKGKSFENIIEKMMTQGLSEEPKNHISNSDIEILIDSAEMKSISLNENNAEEDGEEEDIESFINLMDDYPPETYFPERDEEYVYENINYYIK